MTADGSPPPEGTEKRLRWLEEGAERAYAAMYDAPFGAPAAARYSDAKEYLHDAIALARQLGRDAEAESLGQRLAHIKSVYRKQFSP